MKVKLFNTDLGFVTKGTPEVVYEGNVDSSYNNITHKLVLNLILSTYGISSGDFLNIEVTAPSGKQSVWGTFDIFQLDPVIDFGQINSGGSLDMEVNNTSIYIGSKNADSSGVDGDCQIAIKIKRYV